jgi:putative chitinase
MINEDKMNQMFEGSGKYASIISKAIEDYEINNVPMLIAQIGHESGGLKVFEENLNYSGKRLLEIFPRYFTPSNVNNYAGKPEAIANRVYANRMGNGNEASGDGFKFKGRGAIQLTGKETYSKFASDMEKTLDEIVEYIKTSEGSIESAAWFWNYRDINSVSSDIIATTRKINGGLNGLNNRKQLYAKAEKIFK